MTPTEELRRMLDERGIKYGTRDGMAIKNTYWNDGNGRRWGYAEDVTESGTTLTTLFLVSGQLTFTPTQAIDATLGEKNETPYDRLIERLREDWNIEVSWDGLRKFWHIGLTENGMRERDERNKREASLGRGTCELEINSDMTAVVCSKCRYPMPHGTVLAEMRYCPSCGRKVVNE